MNTEQPAHFTDRKGRVWHLELNVNLARRIKAVKGIDLLDYERGLARLYENPIDLADVLWLFCEEQAPAEIDDEEFGKRLGGDAIDEATRAMCQALVNFSPRHRRPALAALHRKVDEVLGRAAEVAIERLGGAELEAEIEKLLKTTGKSSGD